MTYFGVFDVNGNVTITQGNAPGDVAYLDGDTINNVSITQGDNVQAPNCTTAVYDIAEINDTTVTSNITIVQGTGNSTAPDAGNYVAAIGFDILGLTGSSPVTAGGDTLIDQNYANNFVFLGDANSSFKTYNLDVFTGNGGGANVFAENTTVYDGPLGGFSFSMGYTIEGGGSGNTYFDDGGNSGVTVDFWTRLTPVLTWTDPFEITYGTALDGTELDATASVPGSFVYTPAAGTVLSAGAGQTLSVTFTPTDTTDYTTASATATVNVAQATPTVVNVNPVNITYGTALADGQLSGTAAWTVNGSPITVAGTFTYTSTAGTVLNASNSGQSEAVTFTPTDTADYNSVTTAVTINVSPALLTVTANAKTKVYGSADPALTYQASGFQLGDTAASVLTGGLTRAAGEHVGSYAISQGSLTADSDYTISFTRQQPDHHPGHAHRHRQPPDQGLWPGDPALTYQASGFQFSDTAGSVLTGGLTRARGEHVAGNLCHQPGHAGRRQRLHDRLHRQHADHHPGHAHRHRQPPDQGLWPADPALTYQASGFQFSDTAGSVLTGGLTRAAGEHVAGNPMPSARARWPPTATTRSASPAAR